MSMGVRLSVAKTYRYSGLSDFRYLVSYDYAAGKNNRYTVIRFNPTTNGADIIGRELDLVTARKVIRDSEERRVPTMPPELEKPRSGKGDEHMGAYVYCNQHLAPHSTGWCSVHPRNKIALKATTPKEAYTECVKRGFKLASRQ